MCELGFFVNNGDTVYNPHLDICNKEIKVTGSWTYQAKDWLQAMETNIRMDAFKIAIVNE